MSDELVDDGRRRATSLRRRDPQGAAPNLALQTGAGRAQTQAAEIGALDRQSDPAFRDVHDAQTGRTFRMGRIATGSIDRWLLDRCYQDLLRVAGCIEVFPWSYTVERPGSIRGSRHTGKWLLFPDCSAARECWTTLCTGAERGSIWQAKISLTSRSPTEHAHVVCVYTPDFRNVIDVRAAGIRLWQAGVVQSGQTIYYKPDAFTLAAVYADSGPSSIYSLRGGTTALRTTRGYERLDPKLQVAIDRNVAALPLLDAPAGRVGRDDT